MSDLLFTNGPVPYREDFYQSLRKFGVKVCFGTVAKDLHQCFKVENPARVFVPEFSSLALAALRNRKRFGCKVISICDDSLDMIAGNDFGWKHRLARWMVPSLFDEIILHSPDVRDWYRKRFGKGLWMPVMADERRVRSELERVLPLSGQLRPTDKPIVAFVGRFVALKNIPSLIEAFRPLEEQAQLVLIGDGPERAALETLGSGAIFTGRLTGDDLLAWYNLIDVLVLPSTQEAYGAVTGEALMAGAKVVVSRKAGSSDLVREGENGHVVDPYDVEMLTDCIGRLLNEVVPGRTLALRNNLHPYRFADCMNRLVDDIRSL